MFGLWFGIVGIIYIYDHTLKRKIIDNFIQCFNVSCFPKRHIEQDTEKESASIQNFGFVRHYPEKNLWQGIISTVVDLFLFMSLRSSPWQESRSQEILEEKLLRMFSEGFPKETLNIAKRSSLSLTVPSASDVTGGDHMAGNAWIWRVGLPSGPQTGWYKLCQHLPSVVIISIHLKIWSP